MSDRLGSPLEALALSVARCRHLDIAMADQAHPCHEVAACQVGPPATRQVPEGWAGALATAKVATLSSNPSISEPTLGQSPDSVECYPRSSWQDEEIAHFAVNRFGPDGFATEDGRALREDGAWSAPVKFWLDVRRLMGELLGGQPSPDRDYVMIEVVHCKSRGNEVSLVPLGPAPRSI